MKLNRSGAFNDLTGFAAICFLMLCVLLSSATVSLFYSPCYRFFKWHISSFFTRQRDTNGCVQEAVREEEALREEATHHVKYVT